MKRLLLIDANSLIHRAFHALPPLSTPDGKPIQAIYGISNILLKLWREERPDFAAALFDRPEPTFRKEKFVEYKAQRPKAPDELISQIIEAHTLFEKFGIKTFEKPGFEADDGIATLAEKFKNEKNLQVMILTGDLDTLQLVHEKKVVVRTFKKGVSDTMVYDRDAVIDRFGLPPEKLIDYKALVGDPSDNIKGIPGVGPKTATELIQKFGSIEELYKYVPADPKLQKKFGGTEKEALFMKELVTLNREVPLSVGELQDLKIEDGKEEIVSYFKSLGFESFIRRLEESRVRASEANTESLGAEIPLPDAIYILPEREAEKEEALSAKTKVAFGVKETIKKLKAKKIDFASPYADLGIGFWLLDPDFKNYEPAYIFPKFFKKEWEGTEGELQEAYAYLIKKLREYDLEKVFYEIEMPALRVLAEMEMAGIGIEIGLLAEMEKKINRELVSLTQGIYDDAGETFNINSSQQLGRILFDKLSISKKPKKTPGGQYKTDVETLEELKGEHQLVYKVLEYRELFKLQSTYVKPLQELQGKDGKIHAEFIQTGTGTGRISSQNPNMQNIPKGSSWAEELRSAFVASKGYSFIAFDYSQLELRILAALSQDPKMKEAFQKGEDIHRLTAASVLRIPLEKVQDKDRKLAKTLNFGLIYGMGVTAFSKTSGLSRDEAQKFIDAYFQEFSRIREWQEEVKRNARTYGYVQTLTGRRRYVGNIVSDSPRFRSEAERVATNHPVQGFEADLLKLAMIKTREFFEREGLWGNKIKLLLSIHDELLFEVSDDIMKRVAEEVKLIMERVYPLEVPLQVEISSGKNWGHMKKI